MLKQDCIDTKYRSETLFPSGLTLRTWLLSGMELAACQAIQAAATLKRWRNRSHQRRVLAELPDYMLKDIGIGRMDALQEADKPFWRA